MKYSQVELEFIIGRIGKQLYELTDWEQKFFLSVSQIVESGRPLSDKQAECLSNIWDNLS